MWMKSSWVELGFSWQLFQDLACVITSEKKTISSRRILRLMSALAPVSWAVEVFCPFLGCFGFLFVCFFYCGHSPTARAAAMAGAATNARGATSWVAKAAFYIQPKSGKFSFFRKPWETLALFWHLGVWTLRVSVVASQPWTSGAANHGLKVLGNVISRLISAGKLEETSAGVKKKNTNCENLSWPR